jgi:hypothetical protein
MVRLLARLKAWLQSFVRVCVRLIVHVWRWLRVLWVCRVSAASAIGGGLLLSMVPQARDLFADTGFVFSWFWFFVFLLVWAWVVHMMARRALQFDEWVPAAHASGGLSEDERQRLRKEFELPAICIPRLLGLSIFLFVALALGKTWLNLWPGIDGLQQARLAAFRIPVLLGATALATAVYLFLVIWRRSFTRMMGRSVEAPLLAGAQSMLILLANPVKNWPTLKKVFSVRANAVLGLIGVGIVAAFFVAVTSPAFLSDWVPRALFLPLLLGGGVLLFGEIASLSHRWQTPLLLVFLLAGGVVGYLLENYNDVRWIAAPTKGPASAQPQQATIGQAIDAWKASNCTRNPCEVRPIVITGAGGASRAGFFTATVVGALMDAGEPGKVRNRIFALSTVSGSSVGAAMMRAAWMDAIENGEPDQPPCKEGEVSAWFGSTEVAKKEIQAKVRGKVQESVKGYPWRDCFQKLMAGDFLSTVFVGIAYRDIFPIGGLVDANALDRSGLLRDAFERWYTEIVEGRARSCRKDDAQGLCRPIGHLQIAPVSAQRPWIPLLFINGTSVTTGRRIIVSDVRVDCYKKPDEPFLHMAYDVRELRNSVLRIYQSCDTSLHPRTGREDNLALSGAAMMSARFPIISTHGAIRNLADNKARIVDTIVDGGYFENDGLATAADIVRELKDAKLEPVVIRITNDPSSALSPPRGSDVRPMLPAGEDRTLFDTYTSIGRALYATRSGHEDGHLDYLRGTLDKGPLVEIGVGRITPLKDDAEPDKDLCRLDVGKNVEMETVSMSWWMSQPVQAYLDAQLCRKQAKRLACVLNLTAQHPQEADEACPVR